MMYLAIIKLASGEQVIGQSPEMIGDHSCAIKNPRLILAINPQQSILAPFMLATDETVNISTKHIVAFGYEIAEQLRDAYEQQVTGLQLPPTPKIQLVKN